MNEIKIYNHPEFGDLQMVEQDGETWFTGKGQVCFINKLLKEVDTNDGTGSH